MVKTPEKAAIGDRVWLDTNRNGIQESGESGVDGVTVYLFDVNDRKIATTQTANGGHYLFGNLAPGVYHVQFDRSTLPDGYVIARQDQGGNNQVDSDANPVDGITAATDLDAGEHDLSWDMGVYLPASQAPGSWSGSVREDVDNDSVMNDPDDRPIYNVTIILYRDTNGNGMHEIDEPDVGSTTTDVNGQYHFSPLDPGEYVAVEVQPSGYIDVRENEGGTDDDKPDNGVVNAIAGHVDSGEDDSGNDFVEEKPDCPYRIGNLFWIDTNGNGIFDHGERGVANAQVDLLDADGNLIKTTTTDENGHYYFDVPAGDYRVRFHIPQSNLDNGYDFVGIVRSGDDTNKVYSDGVVEAAVKVGSGYRSEDLTMDAAIVCPCSSIVSDRFDALNPGATLLMALLVWLLGIVGLRNHPEYRT